MSHRTLAEQAERIVTAIEFKGDDPFGPAWILKEDGPTIGLSEQHTVANEYLRMRQVIALRKNFRVGSRVTNCIVHMDRPLTQRPESCRLCVSDIKNQLSLAIEANEFLNSLLDQLENSDQSFSSMRSS